MIVSESVLVAICGCLPLGCRNWPVAASRLSPAGNVGVTGHSHYFLNAAPTVVSTVSVIVQISVPLQGPDHPVKVEFPLGVAVSVRTVPSTKVWLQSFPQLMPAGLLMTVPFPDPDLSTVRVGAKLNVATTV